MILLSAKKSRKISGNEIVVYLPDQFPNVSLAEKDAVVPMHALNESQVELLSVIAECYFY